MGIVSERVIALAAEVNLLESKVSVLEAQLASEREESTGTISRLRALVIQHEERIKYLEWELDNPVPGPAPVPSPDPIPTPTPIPDPIPPITSPTPLPDAKITFMGQTFTPSIFNKLEIWPITGETRWRWKVNSEISLVMDVLREQRRVFIERAGAELPEGLPAVETHIKVVLDGEVFYDAPIRIHPHTRSCETFRRLDYPVDKSLELFSSGILPRYDFSYTPTLEDLEKWYWRQWLDLNPTCDKWTEDYAVSVRDWSPGLPLSNEASMLPPWDLFLAKTLGQGEIGRRLYDICSNTWDSSGNFPIHYFDSEGVIYRPDDSRLDIVPRLNPDNLPRLQAKNGVDLPRPDLAHDFGLVLLPSLLTGERYYIEELMAWILLGPLSGSGGGRESGVYFSGQVRASAWWLRSVYYFFHSLPDSVQILKDQAKKQLVDTLVWMNERFVNPNSENHYKTGLCAYSSGRNSNWSKLAMSVNLTTLTGNHHFLAFVLGEINRDENFTAVCEPVLRHVLKVAEGVWRNSPNKYTSPWLQHSAKSRTDGWAEIIANTFAKGKPPEGVFPWPLDTQIISWYRAAVVTAKDLRAPWAPEVLNWIDRALGSRELPPAWAIKPRE